MEPDAPIGPPVTYIMRIANRDQTSYCNFVVETDDGDLAFMGVIKPGVEQQDIWTCRIGSSEWTKIIGRVEGREWIGGFIQMRDGSLAAAGWYSDFYMGDEESLVMKIGAEGDVVWQKTIVGVDRLDGVVENADGNLIVSGSADSNLYLAEIDPSGAMVRQQLAAGGLLFNMFEVTLTSQGDILAVAQSREGAGLAKVSMDGRVHWGRHFYNSLDYSYNEVTVLELSDGRIVMSLDGWIMMLDSTGNPLWQRGISHEYGPPGTDVMEAADEGLIFLSTNYALERDPNMWLFMMDTAGNMLWQETLSVDGLETGSAISGSSSGGLLALSGGANWSNLALLDMDGSMHGECDALVETTLPLAPASATFNHVNLTLNDPAFAMENTSLPSRSGDVEISYPCPPERQ